MKTGISFLREFIANNIYRDVRFTNDKTPCKNHFGAYIAPVGLKSMLGGYYFHIEPSDAGYLNHSMWAGGIYVPDAPTLKAIRTYIYENTQEYKSIIQLFKTHY